jgi:hypothetical protein
VVLAVGGFYDLLDLPQATLRPYQQPFPRGIEVPLEPPLVVGLAVVANNLSMVVFGSPLGLVW